jgi:hypothetical protein
MLIAILITYIFIVELLLNDYMKKNISQDESNLEFLFHDFWIPEWNFIKMNVSIYHLEHFEECCKNILKLELDKEVDKDSVKDLLIVDIIASTMFLIESLGAISNACCTDPKNMQEYFRNFSATKFYSDISSKDNEYYARILSIPQTDFISESDDKKLIIQGISDLKEFLNEVKEYYFSNLDLFNSYKHGFRLFPINTIEENNEPVSAIMYYSQKNKTDEVILTRMEKNPQKHHKLAKEIIYFKNLILENHKNKLKQPRNWDMTIPMRTKSDMDNKN